MQARVTTQQSDMDKLPLTLTVTMTLDEWRQIMRALPVSHPSWQLGMLIATAIGAVGKSVATIVSGKELDT